MKKVERKILLNPGPATTTDTVKNAMVVSDICPREEEFGQLIEGIKADLVKVVHGEGEYKCALFAASGTGGLEAAITSSVPEGKKLLVVENGAYGARMVKIAETFGIPVVHYKMEYGDYPDVTKIEEFIKADKDISHLAIVHHETTTGMLNPIQEVCDLAHANDIQVIVDCMSSYAGIPIDVKKWKAEYIISSSNKCIQGMAGLVFVIFKESLLLEIQKQKRSFYFNLYNQLVGFEKTGQMQFTPPVQVCYALRQAIDEYFEETEKGRWSRYQENWDVMVEGLQNLGFSFLLPYEQQSKILLAVIEPKSEKYDFNEMHDFLYNKGITIYPGKGASKATFRLSVLGDLYKEDIQLFLKEFKTYTDKL